METCVSTDRLQRILSVGVALTAERDFSRLLDTILSEAMSITGCDAGTLYLLEDGKLHFKIMRNHTLGVFPGSGNAPAELPSFDLCESNVASYVVIHRRMENIADVYDLEKFDFTGPRHYDTLTGYRTKSMLVIPLINNRDEIVGVLQLINALDSDGRIIAFSPDYEDVFRSISSLAAVAITNMRYNEENRLLFQSLIEVLAAAIDERSSYNANHTRNVAELTKGFIDFLNRQHSDGNTHIHFTAEMSQQIVTAAWLHDVGKIITPLEIMDKSTRLGEKAPIINLRFETILALERVRFLEKITTETEYEKIVSEINEARELCAKANSGAPASDDELALIRSYGLRACPKPGGEALRWLEPDEIESLVILSGTLTSAERRIMEEHVEITSRLLEKIRFSNEYRYVPDYAADHHEKLNGRGYPSGKADKELPAGTRILSVVDVFEALTARDRPYKKAIPYEKAFDILDEMADKGELDAELVGLLRKWKRETGDEEKTFCRSHDCSLDGASDKRAGLR